MYGNELLVLKIILTAKDEHEMHLEIGWGAFKLIFSFKDVNSFDTNDNIWELKATESPI